MQQTDLPVEMARFVKAKKVIYDWDWRALKREVVACMVRFDITASTVAREHLLITPQLLADLVAGRRKWTFELVKRLVNINRKEGK